MATTGWKEASGEASLKSSVLRGGTLLFGRQVVSIALKLVGMLLITRVLRPESYGAYAAAGGIYQYLVNLGQAGIGVALVRHQGELTETDYGTGATLLALISLVLIVAAQLAMPLLSAYVRVSEFELVARILLLAIPIQCLTVPALSRLERNLDYRSVAAVELTGQVTYYLVAVPLVFGGAGPVALAGGVVAQQAAALVLAHVLGRSWPVFRWHTGTARRLLAYSVSFSLQNYAWNLRSLVNPLIVGPALGAYALGVVGMTINVIEMLSVLRTVAWRLAVAAMRRIADDPAKLRNAVTQGMELQTLAVGTVLLGFSWFGGWIVPLVFGAPWLPVLELYPCVALAYLAMGAFNMQTATLSVLNRNYDLLAFCALHVLLLGGAAYLATPVFGLKGYGVAELTALPAYVLAHAFLAHRIGSPHYGVAVLWWAATGIGLFWRELGPWAIAAPFFALCAPSSLRVLRRIGRDLLARRLAPLPPGPPVSLDVRIPTRSMPPPTGVSLPNVSQGTRRTVVVLTVREAHSDFRAPIAREFARLGHETYYVYLKRRPAISRVSADGEGFELVGEGLLDLLRWARRPRNTDQLLVLNSSNLAFPGTSLLLRALMGGRWCFDLHDDLLYNRRGLARRGAALAQRALLAGSHFSVHAAPSLIELFPHSHHLGNASDVTPRRRDVYRPSPILVLASFDDRLDWTLLAATAAACPEWTFHLRGAIGGDGRSVRERLDALVAGVGNVAYLGPYRAVDLDAVLAEYALTFAPYAVGSALTRYIDPLRFYHGLRAGLEVITTPIPAAEALRGDLHVVRTADAFRTLTETLAADSAARLNAGPVLDRFGWRATAERLLDLSRPSPSGTDRTRGR